jgi:signal peptidase II
MKSLISQRTRHTLLLLVVGLTAAVADQATKGLVRQHLEPWKPVILVRALGGILQLNHIHNTGAAFGLFPGGGMFFAGVAIVVVVAILLYQRSLGEDDILLRLALGLQLGGAVGNLIDRLRFGYVTDFVYVKYWSTFNVADACIVVGIVLLGYHYLRLSEQEQEEVSQAE